MSSSFVTPWTVVHQAPLSMGFPSQEYWSGLPFSPPADLSDPEIKPVIPVSAALAGGFFTTEPPGKPSGQWDSVKHEVSRNGNACTLVVSSPAAFGIPKTNMGGRWVSLLEDERLCDVEQR